MPQRLRCDVTEVVHHGDRVYSVFLKPESLVPRFLPGQFLHLALDPFRPGDFWPDSRTFSIASAPTERNLLRLTYAVKGKFTMRMESELRAGRQVWIKLPYGEFTVDSGAGACLLAGGTGITAFSAFLAGLPSAIPHPVYLFYGARSPDLLIYRALVEDACQRCQALHVVFSAEQSADGIDCLPGRIDLDAVWKSLPDPLAFSFYIAGPPEMIRLFSQGLRRYGVPDSRIVIDAWE